MPRRKLWIVGAIKRPGALRLRMKELGLVKGDARIPIAALRRAAAGEFGPTTARRARLALTMRGFKRAQK